MACENIRDVTEIVHLTMKSINVTNNILTVMFLPITETVFGLQLGILVIFCCVQWTLGLNIL